MDSVDLQLEDLLRLNADTELRFDDGGALPANVYVLSFFSSVLRGAVEAHSGADTDSRCGSSTIVIPMDGVTKAQWLAVAPFWHPVEPALVMKEWEQLELVLRIGSRFDLRPALDRASDFLAANIHKLTVDSIKPTISTHTSGRHLTPQEALYQQLRSRASSSTITVQNEKGLWKWLRLADELRLTTCLPALVQRAVAIDTELSSGCRVIANTQGLSAATLQRMLAELAGGAFCSMFRTAGATMCWQPANVDLSSSPGVGVAAKQQVLFLFLFQKMLIAACLGHSFSRFEALAIVWGGDGAEEWIRFAFRDSMLVTTALHPLPAAATVAQCVTQCVTPVCTAWRLDALGGLDDYQKSISRLVLLALISGWSATCGRTTCHQLVKLKLCALQNCRSSAAAPSGILAVSWPSAGRASFAAL